MVLESMYLDYQIEKWGTIRVIEHCVINNCLFRKVSWVCNVTQIYELILRQRLCACCIIHEGYVIKTYLHPLLLQLLAMIYSHHKHC